MNPVTKRPQLNSDLIRRVLGSDYLELSIVKIGLEESLDAESSKVVIDTVDAQGNVQSVEGEGCGLVDALFSAMMGRYAIEYQSLETVELANFSVVARLDTKNRQRGADSVGEVTVEARNSEGALFTFSDSSRSMVTSTARAVVALCEYFVNAERAFITLYKSREDARARSREDLVTRYTGELSEVVKSTSYAEVIENMKRSAGV